jgi:type IV secretion system protein VirB6
MSAIQPPGSGWHGNPFDGLQGAYDQMQAASNFFTRAPISGASPQAGGAGFAAMALNMSSFLTLFATLGLVLTAKIVLGLLLALGPLFVAFLLFDGTRGVFEGWLRAVLAFAFVPLFATLALVVQLTLLAPHLLALAKMMLTNQPDLPAATAILILTLVAVMVSLAGIVGLFVVAIGFKWPQATRMADTMAPGVIAVTAVSAPGAPPLFQPRIVSVSAAAAALDRRDLRIDQDTVPRRFSLGPEAEPAQRAEPHRHYRRSAQPRMSAGSARRDK